jgi:hypothetical protein
LVDVHALGLPGERRGDLHAAGSGSDHGDPLAAGVVVVVPCIGPQNATFELVDAVDVDLDLGVDVATDRADHEPRGDVGAPADRQPPHSS